MPAQETETIAILNDAPKRIRVLCGWTLDQLSKATGVSVSALSKAECCIEALSPSRAVVVDRALRQALAAHALEVADELDRIRMELPPQE
jgi:transcriptional regulator with XRE-family HTH domain